MEVKSLKFNEMLEVLKKLLQQPIEFNRNNHPSRLFEQFNGISNKMNVFDRIALFFFPLENSSVKFYAAFY